MRDLISFLNDSPVNFLAAATVCDELDKCGFTRLDPTKKWDIKPGGAILYHQKRLCRVCFHPRQ